MGSFLQHRELGPTPDSLPHPLHGGQATSDFHWCLICERSFRRDRYRLVDGKRLCPTPGCEGGQLFEPWEWTRVLAANPDYPPIPLEDVAYPFFGSGTRAAGQD
jgi:hypothetical protein